MSAVSPRDLAIPTSILLGAALVAWVVHRDLTAIAASLRSPPASALAAAAPVSPLGAAPANAPVALPAIPVTGEASLALASPEVRERDAEIRRREQTQNVLASQRGEYARICLGSAKGSPPLRLIVEFDANGNEAKRSAQIAIPALAGDSTVAKIVDCVTHGNVPKLKLDAPGKPVTMVLGLSFP